MDEFKNKLDNAKAITSCDELYTTITSHLSGFGEFQIENCISFVLLRKSLYIINQLQKQLIQNELEYSKHIEDLATEIETLKNPLRPIETAPMDGTQILIITRAGFVYSASYDIDSDKWQLDLGQTLMKKYAAHWMPIPEAPK